MEAIIADLVKRFEAGTVSRRDLIRNLTMLTAAAGFAPAARAQEAPFTSTRIDHISVQVTDLAPSIAFYESVFGLSILNEDRANEIVRMGTTSVLVSLHRKSPTGIVDHYAIAVDGFEREHATQTLTQMGLEPAENLDYGFHVRDPAGIPVQLVGS